MLLPKFPFAACYCGTYTTQLQFLNATTASGAEPRGLHFLTGAEAFSQFFCDEQPEWVVFTSYDLSHGLKFLSIVREKGRHTRIILCVMPDSPPPVLHWPTIKQIGPDALCTLPELQDCLTACWENKHYRSCLLHAFTQLANCCLPPPSVAVEPAGHLLALTMAERRILREMLNGLCRQQIATALFISPRTVDNHKANMASKLGSAAQPYGLTKYVLLHKKQLGAWLESTALNE